MPAFFSPGQLSYLSKGCVLCSIDAFWDVAPAPTLTYTLTTDCSFHLPSAMETLALPALTVRDCSFYAERHAEYVCIVSWHPCLNFESSFLEESSKLITSLFKHYALLRSIQSSQKFSSLFPPPLFLSSFSFVLDMLFIKCSMFIPVLRNTQRLSSYLTTTLVLFSNTSEPLIRKCRFRISSVSQPHS